ncbi:unnamed protein product, partial [Mesorhabditis belari]|uniref:Uncharacterized protein n=1 Tax=Mesorhabditis belari TaxID=2138241 RepID=A0AAF3EKG0_9BILA
MAPFLQWLMFFCAWTIHFTNGQDEELPSGKIDFHFKTLDDKFVVRKNATFLKDNNGKADITIYMSDQDYEKKTRTFLKLELLINDKTYEFAAEDWLYNDLEFQSVEFDGKWVLVTSDFLELGFKYNTSSPDFELTVTETTMPETCTCLQQFDYNYPYKTDPKKYAKDFTTATLDIIKPKECQFTSCVWFLGDGTKEEQDDLVLTFSGKFDPVDQFFVKVDNGTVESFKSSSKNNQHITVSPKNFFTVHFIAGANPKTERHLKLQYNYTRIISPMEDPNFITE